MFRKTVLITLVIFLFSIFNTLAIETYNQTGNENKFYQQGTGFFNAQLSGIDTFTRTIGTQRQTPLIADLDGNGVNEIIILDDDTFRLFQNKELDVVDSFTLQDYEAQDHFITFDIDGDNRREIIATDHLNGHIYILEYNGTAFFNQTTLSGLNPAQNQEYVLQCKSANNCIVIETNSSLLKSEVIVHAMAFNSTTLGNRANFTLQDESGNEIGCLPKFKHIVAVDYDGDNEKEYIFSMIALSSNVDTHIMYLEADNTDVPTLDKQIVASDIGTSISSFITASGSCNNNDHGKYLTSPMVFDIDASSGNGLETVYGFNVNIGEFKMNSFRSNGAFLDDYPEVFNADGEIISNVMKANIFSDTDNIDFCVLGNDANNQELDLLCASELSGHTFETLEFKFNFENSHNITQVYGFYNPIAHTVQHLSATEDIGVQDQNNNPNEVINSYGVFKVEDQTFNGSVFIKTLTRIFENPKADSVVIPVDAERVGREDLILLQNDTNLWYIDDRFTNTEGQITEFEINPCVDSTWKQNTTVSVTIKVEDVDSDDVSARAKLYESESSEQDSGFSVNTTSGTSFNFGFIANVTTGSSTLKLIGRDIENPTVLNEIDLTFSVATNGIEFGDCSSTVIIGITPENLTTEEELFIAATGGGDPTNNAIVTALATINDITGLGTVTIFLIAIFVTMLGIFSQAPNIMGFGMSIIAAIMLLVIGTLFGILGTGIIITIVTISIIIVAVFVAKMITGAAA